MKTLRILHGKTILAALAAGLALPMVSFGQAPGQDKGVSVSKVVRMNNAPVSKEVLRVKLGKPVEATLSNGLTVMIMEDHRFPTVSILLNISGAGGIFDPPDTPGLATFTAQMLREGTRTRASRQIAEEIDRLGATMNATAGFGSASTGLNASGLRDNFDEWFALATDLLLNPSFPAEEWSRLKQRTKAQITQQRGNAGFLVNERFNKAVYGSHPASRIAPTPEALEKLTPEALAAWHKERYLPQNAILGIAGDVDAKTLLPKLENWLGGWQKSEWKETLPTDAAPASGRKVYLVDRPGSVQTDVALGNIGINRKDPDYVPLVVMNRIVGDGPAARLFLNLREEKGYTYGVYSFFGALKHKGTWTAGGNMRTDVTEGALNEFMKEFARIRDEKVPEAELEEAKRAVVAGFALSLEQATTLLNFAVIRKIYGFPGDYWDTYPAKIMAVTAEDVQRVARKYVDVDRMQIVAVGDGSKIKSILEKLGPVEVYDTDGKPATVKASSPGGAPEPK